MSIELEEYSDLFAKNNIDGSELLTLDSARIKVCIFTACKDESRGCSPGTPLTYHRKY